MPLCWAHAEYLKLRRSLVDGAPFDTPPQPVERYQVEQRRSAFQVWRFEDPRARLPAGLRLRIELREPATVHWSSDGWVAVRDTLTRDTGLGIHVADLDTARLRPGCRIAFTFHWSQADRWEGTDFEAAVVPPPEPAGVP
jgi:glucoamylase